MKMDTLIQASNLSRQFGKRTAVDNLDIELKRGDILGFLGPNGAGKSTSMRMLTGNLVPNAGRVQVNGVDLLEQPLEAKRNLGYLPESPPVYRDLTVDEYLDFVARLNAIPKSEVNAAVIRAKERCGLSEVGHRLIGNLSKGYQQRVGIAQAIIHNPTVVVLDEPTVGLDPNQIREIRQLIRELGEAHSVILSTHILPEVQTLCNRVQIINQGRTVYQAELGDEFEQADSIRVCLAADVGETELTNLEGVERVEQRDTDCFELWLHSGYEVSLLSASLINAGWGLKELTPQRRSLEQIFVELTTGEGNA